MALSLALRLLQIDVLLTVPIQIHRSVPRAGHDLLPLRMPGNVAHHIVVPVDRRDNGAGQQIVYCLQTMKYKLLSQSQHESSIDRDLLIRWPVALPV